MILKTSQVKPVKIDYSTGILSVSNKYLTYSDKSKLLNVYFSGLTKYGSPIAAYIYNPFIYLDRYTPTSNRCLNLIRIKRLTLCIEFYIVIGCLEIIAGVVVWIPFPYRPKRICQKC